MAYISRAPKCPRCDRAVYAAEEIIGPEGPWHRACFKCRVCACRLDATTMMERDSDVYCKSCFRRGAAPEIPAAVNARPEARHERGEYARSPPPQTAQPPPQTPPRAGFGGATGLSPSSVFSSGRRGFSMPAAKDICPRCAKPIYHAEKVVGPGGPWHRACFKCRQCGTALSSTKLTEHEGEAFCQVCYTKLYSPRGYNIGGSTEPLPPRTSPSPRASPVRSSDHGRAPLSQTAYRQRALGPGQRSWESPAAGAGGLSLPVARSGSAASRPEPPRNRLSFGQPYRPRPVAGLGAAPPDICPRCSSTIYAAEQGIAAGRKYHRRCIRCAACDTSISSLQIAERDGDIYCKQCYAKNFGPKGYRPSLGPSINDH
ncbi:cysteine and glycine-rich protein [Coemansia nantahalensis]|nr:cysteine and glycine-rich protein [Coemansia nantahalensis]